MSMTDVVPQQQPPYRSSDVAPFICFDVVAANGIMNGAIQIELAGRIITPGPGQGASAEFVTTARLRCSPAAAALLRGAIDSALTMLTQPSPQSMARPEQMH